MIRSQIKVCGLLLLLALTNAMGQAGSPQVPPGTGRISGRVFDVATGKPLAGVNVTLGRTDVVEASMVTTTAADGSYEFGGLVPGDYVVSAHQTGFARLVYGYDLHLSEWTPLTLRSGEAHNHIDVKLHPYAGITQMDRDNLPTSLPAGYSFGPSLFSPDGKLIALAITAGGPEQACLYDRVSHRLVSVTGGREVNGSMVSLQMAWIGDALYVQTGNTVGETHFFVASATGAKEIHQLPPEAAEALKHQEDSGLGSARSSARVNRSIVKSENLGSGHFSLFIEALDGQNDYQIAKGTWELENFVFEPDRSSILYLDTLMDMPGESPDSAIVTLDLNTRQSQGTYLPLRAAKLLAAVQEGDSYLAAFTTYGLCEPEVLSGGSHQTKDPPENVCFASVPFRASH